jgi:hypothetical protein
MSKRARLVLVGIVAVLPFAAGACKVPVGNGCSIWLQEPGVNFGVVCN